MKSLPQLNVIKMGTRKANRVDLVIARSVAFVLLLVAVLTSHKAVAQQETLRIMAVGDSITVGSTNPTEGWTEPYWYGYRSVLYNLLTDTGYDFQFVGSSTERLDHESISPGTTPPADLDALGQSAHHGFGGANASDLQGSIVDALNTNDPDIILLMIGTNGGQNITALTTLLDTITTQKPDAQLILAQIIPNFIYSQSIVDYNTYIEETMIPAYQDAGRNVTLVDQYSNFLIDPNDLTSIDQSLFSNGINHPDNEGYSKIAQTWFEGIQGVAAPAPEPSSLALLGLGGLAMLCRRRA